MIIELLTYFVLLFSVYIWAAETLFENLVIQHMNVPSLRQKGALMNPKFNSDHF